MLDLALMNILKQKVLQNQNHKATKLPTKVFESMSGAKIAENLKPAKKLSDQKSNCENIPYQFVND